MSLSRFERATTFRTATAYTSGSTAIDASGNMAYFTMYSPNESIIIGPISGHRVSTGVYEYFPSTQATDDLGIYILKWNALFNYQHPWDYSPKVDREAVEICYVK